MELPVIATRIRGCSEAVIDGETGILVPPGDPESLAGAILDVLSDGELGRLLGKNARTFVASRFSATAVNEELLQEYLRLTSSSRDLDC